MKNPLEILTREVKEFQSERVLLVTILWHSHDIKETTWELEKTRKSQYPNLVAGKNFNEISLEG